MALDTPPPQLFTPVVRRIFQKMRKRHLQNGVAKGYTPFIHMQFPY